MTALMAACANKNESATIEEFELCAKKNEAVALLLMEATQKAGALDVQVNVVWSVCWEGGLSGGGGRGGEGGRGVCGGALTHACTCFQRAVMGALFCIMRFCIMRTAVVRMLSMG